MKTQKELREELDRAYKAAAEQLGIENWGDFAKQLGIPVPTMYRMIGEGGKISATMLRRIYVELALKGVTIEGSPVTFATNTAQNVSAPVTQTTTDERWFDLVAEKDKQIDRLLGIIETMQK